MGKLIMWNSMTLDGTFEGAQSWDLEFHEDEYRIGLVPARSARGARFASPILSR